MDEFWDDEMMAVHLGTTEDLRWDLMPYMFTAAIVCSRLDEDWYLDRWCYKTPVAALEAFKDWDPTTYKWDPATRISLSEPQGWHRHPPTGRRRENGDPSTEVIRH